MEIGVGITTYNRSEMLKNILPIWINRSPKDTLFAVHIDGDSKDGYEWLNKYPYVKVIRDFERKGIAKSKNACMNALKECNHIFMADDDIYPKESDWYRPFIASMAIHSCYITLEHGGNVVKRVSASEIAYTGCGGMLLYFRKEAKEERYVEDFGIYGFEHVEISERIWRKYQKHLFLSPFVAPKNLEGKFYSFDYSYRQDKEMPEFEYELEITSSIEGEDVDSYIKVSSEVKKEIDKNK